MKQGNEEKRKHRKRKLTYKEAKKKYSEEEIKEMFLLGEINLTMREWKENDKKVNKDHFGINPLSRCFHCYQKGNNKNENEEKGNKERKRRKNDISS